jgi:hypothetical protein
VVCSHDFFVWWLQMESNHHVQRSLGYSQMSPPLLSTTDIWLPDQDSNPKLLINSQLRSPFTPSGKNKA